MGFFRKEQEVQTNTSCLEEQEIQANSKRNSEEPTMVERKWTYIKL